MTDLRDLSVERLLAGLRDHFKYTPHRPVYGSCWPTEKFRVAFDHNAGKAPISIIVQPRLGSGEGVFGWPAERKEYTGQNKEAKALRALEKICAKWARPETEAAFRLGAYKVKF